VTSTRRKRAERRKNLVSEGGPEIWGGGSSLPEWIEREKRLRKKRVLEGTIRELKTGAAGVKD